MPVENNPTYTEDLTVAWPTDGDTRREGGEHLRNIKQVLVNSLLTLDGAPLDYPVLAKILPIGSTVIIPSNAAGASPPAEAYGGTWQKIGTIDLEQMETDGYFTADQGWSFGVGPNLSVYQLLATSNLPPT